MMSLGRSFLATILMSLALLFLMHPPVLADLFQLTTDPAHDRQPTWSTAGDQS